MPIYVTPDDWLVLAGTAISMIAFCMILGGRS